MAPGLTPRRTARTVVSMRQTTPTPYTFAAVHVLLPLLKMAWTDATVAVLEAVKGELGSGSIRYIAVTSDTPGGKSPGMIFWLEHVEANFLDPATGHDPNWNVGEYTAADLERHLGRKPHIMDFDITDKMPQAPVQAVAVAVAGNATCGGEYCGVCNPLEGFAHGVEYVGAECFPRLRADPTSVWCACGAFLGDGAGPVYVIPFECPACGVTVPCPRMEYG